MKKVTMSLLTLIVLAGFTMLHAQTCVNVTSLSGPGTNRSYHHTVSPNGVTYLHYKFIDDESVNIQEHTFAPTSKGFIMKLDKNNNFEWIQRFGQDSDNYLSIYSIISDEDDNCFIHARIYGTTDFAEVTFSTQTPEWNYLNEVVIKLDESGDFVWATRFSGAYDMIDDGSGQLFLHTTLGSINDYIFKENNSDTTHVAKGDGVQNAVFALNKNTGRVAFFTKLRTFIGTINNDHNQTAICNFYVLNNQVYLSAYYTEGASKVNKIFTCSSTGAVELQKTFDGEVYALFDSPVDNSYLYCHMFLSDGTYYTRKYSTDFSTVIAQSENTSSQIFSHRYNNNNPNYFVDDNGDITTLVNPYIPNYFTYNGEKVYENNTQRYAFMQFSPNLELINFKPIIPGWGQDVYANLYYLHDSNKFKLIGYGSIANQIDTVSYAPDGYKSDVYVFDFLNDANQVLPVITLSDSVVSIGNGSTYQMNYTIQESAGDETVTWSSLNSQIVSVDQSGLITGHAQGETSIIVKIDGAEIADTCSVTVTSGTSIAEVLKSSIQIFPNPIANYVSFNTNSLISKVEVYNLAGRKVLETRKAGRIDVSNLSMGMYFFKVYSNDQHFTYKMFKK